MKLTKATLAITALVLIFAQSAAAGIYGDVNETSIENDIRQGINEERQNRSLEPLQTHSGLNQAASNHSKDMAAQTKLFHTNNLIDTYSNAGADCHVAAENIAYTYSSARTDAEVANRLVELWMESSSHKDNILNDQYSQTGIGIAKVGPYILATQNFCN